MNFAEKMAVEYERQREKRSYTDEERARAVELAKQVGLKSASYFLNVPPTTLYGWLNPQEKKPAPQPKQTDATPTNSDELRRSIDELKSAVETLTDAIIHEAAKLKAKNGAIEYEKPSLFCAIESEGTRQ